MGFPKHQNFLLLTNTSQITNIPGLGAKNLPKINDTPRAAADARAIVVSIGGRISAVGGDGGWPFVLSHPARIGGKAQMGLGLRGQTSLMRVSERVSKSRVGKGSSRLRSEH